MLHHEENPAQAAEIIRLLIPVLSRLNIPIIPLNYAIWYEYFLEAIPELNEVLDQVKSGEVEYTDELATSLYNTYFVTTNEQQLERMGSEARELFSNMAGRFDAAGDELAVFQSQLESVESALQEPEKQTPTLGDKIKAIMSSNEEMSAELLRSVEEMNRLKAELEETRRRAASDPLTGIANRKAFCERLAETLEKHVNAEDENTLLMLDIDHFKAVNDDYGHLVGDKVIKFVASTLVDSVKGRDVVGRYGGEEFCVLLEDTSVEDSAIVAEQIRKKIEISKMSRSDNGEELRPVTISIGVAGAVRWDTVESLLEKADKALYCSKNEGRNRVTISNGR